MPSPLIQQGYILVEVSYSLISSGTELATIEKVESKDNGSNSRLKQNIKYAKKIVSHLQNQGISKTVSVISERISNQGFRNESLVPLGYSCSGKVVSLGEGVTGFTVGDLVACAGAIKPPIPN